MADFEDRGRDDRRQICRDFLRNVCNRGRDCKYLHPDQREKDYGMRSKILTFCHDYQNGKCLRYPCKFLHCSDEEEEHYKQTGELPNRILDEPWNKWVAAELLSVKMGETTPVCKDYINGDCTRRNCRFRHISLRELEALNNNRNHQRLPPARQSYIDEEPMYRRRDDRTRPVLDDYEPVYKRRRLAEPTYNSYPNNGQMRSDRAMYVLEEENAILRQRVAELKKRVDDLQATNEFLLEQNAQMRLNDKGAASLTAVTVPAVTITNTAQMQPAQAPNHQVMNAAIRTVTASVATVPVSIAAVAGTPCSIATVSMAPVQIPPAVVTMAQQPSGQNPSMSMSEPPGPLVSYPIMTRPVLQPNISH
ncbi:zinc finger CCCH domain-containing protein 10-like [Macrosteles quadrilineatus]|uniref:zinc finger CCCH domain-containing protein 10-like n=1 Tax=Macrosteles quadrilineatus TaxID=74068 RepID=UPI0023E27536|nr:zinc finger CCCH domain-containing protein 10-like [Macrosteles quadrilineatus]XP_054270971.1 zinc finger CCCH domain-containing protein 10-like [Macrosteles quadrilineatus]